jgi:RHS repeat-associated protein
MRPRFPKTAKPQRAFLDITVLEDRTPVSEQIGTLVGLSWLAQTAWPAPATDEALFGRPALDGWTTPADANPARQVTLIPPAENKDVGPPPPALTVVSPGVPAQSWDPFPLSALDQDLFATAANNPSPQHPRPQGGAVPPSASSDSSRDAADAPILPPSGASAQSDSAAAPALLPAPQSSPDAQQQAALHLPAVLASSVTPLQPLSVFSPTVNPGSTSGQGLGTPPPQNPPLVNQGPLWVLDANNGLTLPTGVSDHVFAGTSADIRAQVANDTITSYTWTLDQNHLSDFTSVSGQSSYRLTFAWNSNITTSHTDTIHIHTLDGQSQTNDQDVTFDVIGTNSPAWVSGQNQPTTSSVWSNVLRPDLLTAGQETLDAQYYHLGLYTGEVMIDHALPTYNTDIAPEVLTYSSTAADRQPIFVDHYQLSVAQSSAPSVVTAQLTITQGSTNVFTGSTIYYNTSQLNPGDIVEIPLQANVATAATGRYSWAITVTAYYSSTSIQTNSSGSLSLVNSAADIGSIFGNGWSLAGFQRLWPQGGPSGPNGALLDLGNGLSLWFAPALGGGFVTPAGDFSTLTYNGSTYQRTLPDGAVVNFGPSGNPSDPSFQLNTIVDTNVNTFTYSYNASYNLAAITDFNGQAVTFNYTGSRVSSITIPTSRTINLGYDGSNRLNSITDPSPDGVVTGPTMTFSYDSSDHIVSLSDPRSTATNPILTTIAYNTNGRTMTVTRADSITEELAALQMAGLASPGAGLTTATALSPILTAQAEADYTDDAAHDWFTSFDWLGFGLGSQWQDPQGDVDLAYHTTAGLPWITADALGRRTRYTFDSKANPTLIALPDDNKQQYTYNGFSQPLTFTDENGNVTTYVRDTTTGNLTSLIEPQVSYTDPNGNTSNYNPTYTMTYFPGGWLQSIQEPNGALTGNSTYFFTTYGYDQTIKDRVTTITYSDPGPTYPKVRYTYDNSGNISSRTDENGYPTTFIYDNLNRLTQLQLPVTSGPVPIYQYAYDQASNLISLTNPLTQTWSYSYDNLNRQVSAQDPLLHTVTTAYDNAGNVLSVKDALQHLTTYFYDSANRLVGVENALQKTTTYVVDAVGQTISVKDPLSNVTSYTYSQRGWLTGVTDPLMNQVTYGYSATGDQTLITEYDPGHNGLPSQTAITTLVYDNVHRLTTYTPAVGDPTNFGYDLDGNMISSVGPHIGERPALYGACGCGRASYSYDQRDRRISQKDSMGKVTTFGYDKASRRILVTDPLGNTVTDIYDPQNRLIVETLPTVTYNSTLVTPTIGYSFDAAGRLASITDPDNNTTTYGYDNANRLSYEEDPRQKYTTYAFDAANNLQSVKDRDNRTLTFGYDDANRLTSERWLNPQNNVVRSITYGYDDANRLTAASGDQDLGYTYGYDAASRLTSDSTAGNGVLPSVVLSYGYDGLNNRISLQDNFSAQGQITYSYNLVHNLTGLTFNVSGQQQAQISLSYDSKNRLSSISRSAPSLLFPLNTTIHWDADDRITEMEHPNGLTLTYMYDDAGRLLFSQDSGDSAHGTRTYTYDNNNQLTNVTGTGESHTYDLNGNRTDTGYVTTVANRLMSDGVYTYSYDDVGNVLVKAAPGDVTTFSWDYRNRMTEAVRTKNGQTTDTVFTYDVWDRRIGKSVTGAVITTVWTAYDGDNPYADFDGNGHLTNRYLYGNMVDELFARYNGTTISWYIQDRLGSVREVLQANGTVLDDIIYDSFGNILTETLSRTADRFKFTGREWDDEIGQYFYRARYYSPTVGRFDSEDPLSFGGGDGNFYRYVGNTPTSTGDPRGLYPDTYTSDEIEYAGTWYAAQKKACKAILDGLNNGLSWDEAFKQADVVAYQKMAPPAGALGLPFVYDDARRARAYQGPSIRPETEADRRAHADYLNQQRQFSWTEWGNDNFGPNGMFWDCLAAAAGAAPGGQLRNPSLVRVPGKPLYRPNPSKDLRAKVEARAPRAPDGRFLDPNTGEPINGKPVLGHKPGHENYRELEKALREGLTQKEFNERMNNPDLYQLEDPRNNSSHRYEKPPD